MNEVVVSAILGIISVIIIKKYIETILKVRNIKHRWLFWGCNLFISIVLGISSGIPLVNMLFNFSFVLYICLIGYKGYIKQKIIVSLSIIIIWAIVEIVVWYISQLVRLQLFSPKVQGSILSKLLTLLLVETIRYIRYRFWPETATKTVPKYWWMTIALPACSIVIVYYIFFLVGQNIDERTIFGGLLSSCLFLPLNLGIFKIYDLLVSEYEMRQRNIVYEQYINQSGMEMKEREAALSAKYLVHDYKKHLVAMQQIAEKHEYKEIELYYKGLNYNLAPDNILVNSGNMVIDAMINSKYSVAIQEGIKYEAQITIPVDMQFDNADLCVILGNALENAYEAVQKTENKLINIAIVYSAGKLTIGIKNTYDGLFAVNQHNNYITRKKDKETHGFGIGIMKRVVDKYDGFMNIESGDSIFTLVIILKER